MKKSDVLWMCDLCGSNYQITDADANNFCCGRCMREYIKENAAIIEIYYRGHKDATVLELMEENLVVMPPVEIYQRSYRSFINFVLQFCDVGKPVYGVVKKEDINTFNALAAVVTAKSDYALHRDLAKKKQLGFSKKR